MATASDRSEMVRLIDAALPQTQCTRCGEPDCLSYAKAVAAGAPVNRCPPGGATGVQRLAELTGRPFQPLDPECGQEGPRQLAWIDEAACIGCTLCIKACPVDCIVGAAKRMHTVIESLCTGCELCLPACPVDCIHLETATPGLAGWAAWSEPQAALSRDLYLQRSSRLQREATAESVRLASRASSPLTPGGAEPASVRNRVEEAMLRARARRDAV